jgi:hypothetical protein
MTSKLISTLFILTAFAFACSNNNSATTLEETFNDTTAYPKQDYSSVTLFVLDSSEKVNEGFYRFIDTNGQPKTKNFKSYKLDTEQIKQLESILVPQPCTDSLFMDKACAPTFRNVFIFYNKENKQIAQVHLCFQCEMSVFIPDKDYMCDFDNKVNWTYLKRLVDGIKQTK